jgi:hypothetical protein
LNANAVATASTKCKLVRPLSRQSSQGNRLGAKSRPTFVVVLRPEPHVADATHAVRRALKLLLRRFGLKCISIEEMHPYDAADDITESVKLGFEVIRNRVRLGGKGWGEQ